MPTQRPWRLGRCGRLNPAVAAPCISRRRKKPRLSLRALLVDDEEPARGELRYLLGAHPELEVVGEAATAGDAVALAGQGRYDVVFLDIELPGMTGIDVARLVLDRRERPAVVFVNAHERYAVDAFAVEAFDYLVKPVEPERLPRVGRRARPRPRGRGFRLSRQAGRAGAARASGRASRPGPADGRARGREDPGRQRRRRQ